MRQSQLLFRSEYFKNSTFSDKYSDDMSSAEKNLLMSAYLTDFDSRKSLYLSEDIIRILEEFLSVIEQMTAELFKNFGRENSNEFKGVLIE